MSVTESVQRLDVVAARRLVGSTEIVVVDQAGEVVERVGLLRYAGHYRSNSDDAFAIRDADHKFRVRSARQLGLTADSPYVAYLAVDFDAAGGQHAA